MQFPFRISKKNSKNVTFKGFKLTCKKMFRFRSSAPIGANLRAKYQHSDLIPLFQKESSFNVLVEYQKFEKCYF